eukprot:scaffold75480_cov18-Prasinocladus_malaysianus.AAC.1
MPICIGIVYDDGSAMPPAGYNRPLADPPHLRLSFHMLITAYVRMYRRRASVPRILSATLPPCRSELLPHYCRSNK